MSYVLLDGKKVSEEIKKELKNEVHDFHKHHGFRPGLAFVLVGDHPASKVYVRSKVKSCQEIGIFSEELVLGRDVSQEDLLAHIHRLNDRKDIHGIIVQHPLPASLNESIVYETISSEKDVDGFHPFNMGRLLLGIPQFIPCTPLGVVEMLRRYKIKTSGAHVVVVGRSNIVGKPAAALFFQKGMDANATVTICHSSTKDLAKHTQDADILIAAIGQAHFIKEDMVKKGVVVIDVGINRVEDTAQPKGYKIVGDVDFEKVAPKASAITPVPGGIGLMTVVMLLKNTLKAAQLVAGEN